MSIALDVPGRGPLRLDRVLTDFTGTLAAGGVLSTDVRERLVRLATVVEIHVITSDTFGTARRELMDLPVAVHFLSGAAHDEQKRAFTLTHNPSHAAAFGNGVNDRLMLHAVRDAGGLAVAVDNGEGCAIDALTSAAVLVHGAAAALDLLLDPRRAVATLRV